MLNNFTYIINLLNVYYTYVGKPNGMVITDEELREELNQVAASNAQVYANIRNGIAPVDDAANSALDDLSEKSDRNKSSSSGGEKEEGQLSPKVLVMQPILRFLQLLCENHNRELQVLSSDQNSNFHLRCIISILTIILVFFYRIF